MISLIYLTGTARKLATVTQSSFEFFVHHWSIDFRRAQKNLGIAANLSATKCRGVFESLPPIEAV